MSEPLHTRRAQYQARAIAGLWRMLSRWPVTRLWRIAAFMGPQIYRFSKRERRVTELNLARVFPDQSAQQRKAFAIQSLQHSTATMLELGHAWMAPPEKVEASILAVHGRDKLDSARAEGRGVIVLAPHFGNWEVLNFWLSSHFPFTAMYEPPKIADLEAITRHGRERMGAQLVPTNPRGVAALLKALKRSEAIGILPDQEPAWGSGVFAPFYGHEAYTATLLPKLVARTQARVVTGVARRIPGKGFEIHFLDADERVYSEDDTLSATGVNASVEASIALDPPQYQWEYKRYRKVVEEQQGLANANDFRLY
ncbi:MULTISPECIES: lysophospholipid acyltransferase family protein [Halomonadaceae]|uniref:Lipid A biosynthesis lauroyl acyltransferase n=2 Tax=Halomonadaceae TaxID=28256 RepID=A0A8H9I421_9GAMM|nr:MULTISPECIES: lysophospholipid acyltransferase family protein [Halomonas]KHJ52078.1 lipid A biosynthesis acyltransferase [Halomonas hydrothermalis]GGW34691.1 lipid A biosynthesis lauroyl acyltransferase [Halomonas hamiltonii]GGW45678.1 lipid A biosynthesis lauroyl acyltransferase [Halomonas johnsoniae]